jgi:S1-C subfamily serine protease
VSRLRLRYLTGPRAGQELLFTGPRVRIGRSRDNDVILHESETPLSSAHHAEARLESGSWWVVDLQSTNHTLLNGVPIQRAQLRPGDRLTVGDDVLSVQSGSRTILWIAAVAALLVVAAVVSVVVLRSRSSPFEDVAARAPQSVYLIALDEPGRRTITGTAFTVDDTRALLATNAHVAAELLRKQGTSRTAGPKAVAVRSDQNEALPITRIWLHPQWRKGSLDHDIALLQIESQPPLTALRLGDDAAVDRLRRGAPVASFGFPAAATDAFHPRGRLTVDVVGDVRLPYLEVGLAIAPGTSGSPIFDQRGAVVGIVVGGDFVDARDGRGRRPSGTEANWAIVATAVKELMDLPRSE